MTENKKISNTKNENYQASWDEYVSSQEGSPIVLLPLKIGMKHDKDKDEMAFYRQRMTAGEVGKIWKGIKNDFPYYMNRAPELFPNPKDIFNGYINHFAKKDGNNSEESRTPFDLNIKQPTWLLFSLGNRNWKFAKKGPQFSTENDADDLTRNFVKIAMFDDPTLPDNDMFDNTVDSDEKLNTRKLLLLANRNRCAPKNLKYNLHVDILQNLFGQAHATTVIIDPGGLNDPQPPFGEGD